MLYAFSSAMAKLRLLSSKGAKPMIIKHKEFPNKRVYEIDYCGRPLRMEIGRMCELANAAVLTLSLIHI